MTETKQKSKKKYNPSKNWRMSPVDITLELLPCGCQKHNKRDLFIAKRGCVHFDEMSIRAKPSNRADTIN